MPGTGAVFLSYRREGTCHIAGRLADRLIERLGSTRVFMDVDTIEPGIDFAAAIASGVASCDVLIVLIGPTWSTIADQRGRRKLDDPDDFVVLEIQAALELEIRVIPVLVDGAVMPDRCDLPERLQDLALRNAVRLDHETFRSDITTLLDTVERILSPLAQEAAEPPVRTGARAADQRAIDSGHAEGAPTAAINLGTLFDRRFRLAALVVGIAVLGLSGALVFLNAGTGQPPVSPPSDPASSANKSATPADQLAQCAYVTKKNAWIFTAPNITAKKLRTQPKPIDSGITILNDSHPPGWTPVLTPFEDPKRNWMQTDVLSVPYRGKISCQDRK